MVQAILSRSCELEDLRDDTRADGLATLTEREAVDSRVSRVTCKCIVTLTESQPRQQYHGAMCRPSRRCRQA